MKMSESIKTIKDKVLTLLQNYSNVRDSDKLLWLAYLVEFHNLKEVLGEDGLKKFRTLLMNEDTPSMESVRRCRQKIQENNPALAGKNRKERMQESESVKEVLRKD